MNGSLCYRSPSHANEGVFSRNEQQKVYIPASFLNSTKRKQTVTMGRRPTFGSLLDRFTSVLFLGLLKKIKS